MVSARRPSRYVRILVSAVRTGALRFNAGPGVSLGRSFKC